MAWKEARESDEERRALLWQTMQQPSGKRFIISHTQLRLWAIAQCKHFLTNGGRGKTLSHALPSLPLTRVMRLLQQEVGGWGGRARVRRSLRELMRHSSPSGNIEHTPFLSYLLQCKSIWVSSIRQTELTFSVCVSWNTQVGLTEVKHSITPSDLHMSVFIGEVWCQPAVRLEHCQANWPSTHTHTTHARTTHTLFLWFMGTLHRRNGFYTVQTVSAIALHLPYT